MALIKCPECGREISDKAIACPNCGFPVNVQESSPASIPGMVSIRGECVDLEAIYTLYPKDKIKAIKELRAQVKISLDDAKKEIDNYYASKKVSFKQQTSRIIADENRKKQEEKQRLNELEKQGVVYCPKCHSTSITYIDKKLSIGRALAGGAIAGDTGAILGGLSSKKGKVKCLKCGHTWKI